MLARTIALLVGVLLPIPVFIDLGRGQLAAESLRGTGLPPVPLSSLMAIPASIWLTANIGYWIRGVGRSRGGILIGAYFVVVGFAALVAALVSPKGGMFGAQVVYPAWALLFGISVSRREETGTAFAQGILIGGVVATCFVMAAVLVDPDEFLRLGRINQFKSPLPGMYQVGNYPPLGLVYGGAIVLALRTSRRRGRMHLVVGVSAMAAGALLFGSRDALLVAAVVFSAVVTWHVRAGRVRPAAVIGAGMFILFVPLLALSPLASFERIRGAVPDGRRIEMLQTRGIDPIADGPLVGRLLTPDGQTSPIVRASSHNTYVDLVVDYGLVGLIAGLLLGIGLSAICLGSMSRAWKGSRWDASESAGVWVLAASVACATAISANLRVPWFQPYTATILFVGVGMLLGHALNPPSRKAY